MKVKRRWHREWGPVVQSLVPLLIPSTSPTPITSLPYLLEPWQSLSSLACCCYPLRILHTPHIPPPSPATCSHMTNTYKACLSLCLCPHCFSLHSPESTTYARPHHFLHLPTTSPSPFINLMCPLALHDRHRPSVSQQLSPISSCHLSCIPYSLTQHTLSLPPLET